MLPIDTTSTSGASRQLRSGLAFDPAGLKSLGQAARKGDDAGLEGAARAFEALLVGQMFKQMRSASLAEGIFDSEQSKLYIEYFDKQIASTLSEGKGLGIREAVMRQLSPATRATGDARDPRALKVPERNPWLARMRLPESVKGTEGGAEVAAAGVAKASDAGAGNWPPESPEAFLAYLRPHAEQAARELGVDPHVLLAQSALESGWGRHVPRHSDGTSSFNLFGIKANKGWSGEGVSVGTLEFRDGIARRERARFRSYSSPTESFNDYVDFLQRNPRYSRALRSTTAQGFVRGLQEAGYATDPRYASKILGIRERLQRMSVEADKQTEAPTQVTAAQADRTVKG